MSDLPGNALDIADLFLEEAGVAVTLGVDFGEGASEYLRVSYATDIEAIADAIRRIEATLETIELA